MPRVSTSTIYGLLDLTDNDMIVGQEPRAANGSYYRFPRMNVAVTPSNLPPPWGILNGAFLN